MKTLEALAELASSELELDAAKLDLNAPLGSLGVDSLTFVDFAFQLEDKFGVTIDMDKISHEMSLTQFGQMIDELLSSKADTAKVA